MQKQKNKKLKKMIQKMKQNISKNQYSVKEHTKKKTNEIKTIINDTIKKLDSSRIKEIKIWKK